jgi:hypothetical protein
MQLRRKLYTVIGEGFVCLKPDKDPAILSVILL